MTEDAAIDLMVRRSFQEEDEARAKWLRARLTSTQLSTYYVGALEMLDLEVEARERAAVAARRIRGGCAAPAHRGRHRGFAGLPAPGAPGVGHRPRHAAHPMGPIGSSRRTPAGDAAFEGTHRLDTHVGAACHARRRGPRGHTAWSATGHPDGDACR